MTWLGVIAGLLLLVLTPAYLRHVLSGSVRPHPVSWGIWATLGILGAAATASAGGGPAVIVLAVTALLEVIVFLAALQGHHEVSPRALWPLAPAVIGTAVWLTAASPLAGALGVVVADSCGLWPTLKKTWADPNSEPPLLWAGGACAFALGCFSVPQPSFASLLYPIYLACGNSLIAVVAWSRAGHLAKSAVAPSTNTYV